MDPVPSNPAAAEVLSYERVLPKRPTPPVNPRQNVVLALLTGLTGAMSLILHQQGMASWLEAVSVTVGAICVWLTVRESVWNFPLGLVNAATFAVVFYRARLFADASLQIIFFVLCAVGWYLWLFGGVRKTELPISFSPAKERGVTLVAMGVLWAGYWFVSHNLGGAVPVFDALTTALSICAQWLLTRKRIENWYLWIVADVIYVPLYWYKDLRLTAGLYVIFLIMALMGLVHWQRLMKTQRVVL